MPKIEEFSIEKLVKHIPAASFALAVSLSLNIPPLTAVITFIALYSLFNRSKSVENGILNLFLAFSTAALLSSFIGVLGFSFDRPWFVFTVVLIFSVAYSRINRGFIRTTPNENSPIQIVASLISLASSVLFQPLSRLENTKLFAMLLPEDNAAWIHASSGFIRFNASATEATSLEYGSRSFLSNFISFFSVPTGFGSNKSTATLSLINVANIYIFLFIIVIYMSSITVHAIYHKQIKLNSSSNTFKNYGYSIIGIITAISLGNVFLGAGHLSLICSVAVSWVLVIFNLTPFDNYSVSQPYSAFWKNALSFPAIFAIGTVWFPLIPISILMLCISGWRFVWLTRKSMTMSIRWFQNKYFLFCLMSITITFIASTKSLRVPSGYSVSSLINVSSGGTMTSTSLTLGLSLLGFVLAIKYLSSFDENRFLLPIIPLGLLAYWIFSFPSNPIEPGYAVEKFSLYVSIIGIPLFLGFVLMHISSWNGPKSSQIFLPLLTCFAIAQLTWGINSLPRFALLDKNNWSVNYLPILLREAESDPKAQLLCVSPNSDFDMTAYSCSRFGSALQYSEFSNNVLARRWRSQLLGGSVDTVNIKETEDFLIPKYVQNFLSNGGKMTVILTPPPFREVLNRIDAEWIQKLPWDQIKVVEQ